MIKASSLGYLALRHYLTLVLLTFSSISIAAPICPSDFVLYGAKGIELTTKEITVNKKTINRDSQHYTELQSAVTSAAEFLPNQNITFEPLPSVTRTTRPQGQPAYITSNQTFNKTEYTEMGPMVIRSPNLTVNFTGGGPFNFNYLQVNKTNTIFNLAAGEYYFDSLILKGDNTTINITSGPVYLHVFTEFLIDGEDIKINVTGNVSDLVVYIHESTFYITGKNLQLTGLIYGTKTKGLTFDGFDNVINGAVVSTQQGVGAAKSITVNKNFNFNFDDSVSDAIRKYVCGIDEKPTINAAKVNNANSVSVAPSDTVTISLSVTGNSAQWRSTGWRLAGSSGNLQCDKSVNENGSGTYNHSFNVSVPNAAGSYNLYLVAYGDDNCSKDASEQFVLNNAIVVQEPTPPPASCNGTSTSIADNFTNKSYSNMNRIKQWSQPWQEIGESDGVNAGKIRVDDSLCTSGNCLRLGTPSNGSASTYSNRGIKRAVDLTNASNAQLTFTYRVEWITGNSTVTLAISNDSGTSWTTLKSFSIRSTNTSPTQETFDISAYANSNTQIRFLISGNQEITGMYIDDINIQACLPSTITPASSVCPGGEVIKANGLQADYFNYDVYSNNYQFPQQASNVSRIDNTINFNWDNSSPHSQINADKFAARWEGYVQAPANGSYIFSTDSDDGVRVWIDNQLIINNWGVHGTQRDNSIPVNLTKDKYYKIKVEYFDALYGAVAKLLWKTPTSQSAQVIPSNALFTCGSDQPVSRLEHLEFSYDKHAISCVPSTINVKACADSTCSSLYTQNVTLTSSPNNTTTPLINGLGSFDLNHSAAGITTLSVTSADTPRDNLLKCYANNVLDTSCSIDVAEAGFLFDVPTLTACKPSADVTIKAVKVGETANQCVAALAGSQTVKFWSNYLMPNSGTHTPKISGSTIGNTDAYPTTINLTFDNNGEATFTTQYDDAGKVQLNAAYTTSEGVDIVGSDEFISKPLAIVTYSSDSNALCSSDDASCSKFKKAGEKFDLKVKAACWEADNDTDFTDNPATPNFLLKAIALSHAVVAPSGGVIGNLLVSSVDFDSADKGEKTLQQSVSEVGVFNVTSTPPAYFGESITATASPSIGRFYPDHFALKSSSITPSCNSYSYMDEIFTMSYQIEAQNAANQVTQNYTGSFIKTRSIDITAESSGSAAQDLSNRIAMTGYTSSNWSKGVYTIQAGNTVFNRRSNGAVDGSYDNLTIGLKVNDSDGVVLGSPTMLSSDNNAGSCAPNCLEAQLGSTDIRYGRLEVNNAHGSELAPLDVSMTANYFNGTNWTSNTADNCSVSNLNFGVHMKTTEPNHANNIALANGLSLLNFAAPGEDNTGYIDITADLAAKPWLQFDWNANGTLANPTGRASFGLFKGSDNIIFRRELY